MTVPGNMPRIYRNLLAERNGNPSSVEIGTFDKGNGTLSAWEAEQSEVEDSEVEDSEAENMA